MAGREGVAAYSRAAPCDGQRDQANGARERTQPTVAVDQSALLEVLDALTAAEVDDRIGQAAQTRYQALIEAELTAVIGAAPNQRTPERSAQRNGHRARVLTTRLGIWSWGAPSCGLGPSSLAPGAAPPGRSGPVRGGDGGLSARGLHPQGRGPRACPGCRQRHLQVGGLSHLCRLGCRRQRLR